MSVIHKSNHIEWVKKIQWNCSLGEDVKDVSHSFGRDLDAAVTLCLPDPAPMVKVAGQAVQVAAWCLGVDWFRLNNTFL